MNNELAKNSTMEDPTKRLSELRDRFWDMMNRGAENEAERTVHKAMSLSIPKELEFKKMHFKALDHYRTANYDESERLLRKAMQIAPGDLEVAEDLSAILRTLSRPAEAYKILQQALSEYERRRIKPTARCLTRLATTAIDCEKFLEAENYFDQIEKSEPKSSLLIKNRLVLFWHYYLVCRRSDSASRSRYLKQMRECIDKLQSLSEDPESDYSILNNLGVVLYHEERYEDSVTVLNKAINVAMNRGLAYFNLGLSKYRLGLFEEATTAFKNSMEKLRGEKEYPVQKVAELWYKFSQLKAKPGEVPEGIPKEDQNFVVFLADFFGELDAAESFLTSRETFFIGDQEYILRPRRLSAKDAVFTVLRHFHLPYPKVPSNGRSAKNFGGGYFLSFNGVGIVIDPGFNFLANLYELGFSILDVDAIVITNSFFDHTNDLEPTLSFISHINSLVEDRERDPESIPPALHGRIPRTPIRVRLYLSHDASNKFISWLSFFADKCIEDVNILVPGEEYVLDKRGVKLTPVRNTLKGKYKFAFPLGFTIDLFEGRSRVVRIGYTSDTAWYNELGDKYNDCDVIIAHIGPIPEEGLPLEPNPTHLGIRGCYELINSALPKVFLISDYGQELEMRRSKIIETFNITFWEKAEEGRRTKCISSQMGLQINLRDLTIKPNEVSEAIPYDQIDENYLVSEHKYTYSKVTKENQSD